MGRTLYHGWFLLCVILGFQRPHVVVCWVPEPSLFVDHARPNHVARTTSSLLTSTATPQQEPPHPKKPQRKQPKQNKYAQFSKVQPDAPDPFDALLAETQQKLDAIAEEERLRQERKQQQRRRQQLLLTDLPQAPAFSFPQRQHKDDDSETTTTTTIDPYDPTTFGYTEIGLVVGAHGVRGWLKVESQTQFGFDRLCTAGIRHLKPARKRAPRPVVLLQGKPHASSSAKNKEYYLIELDQVTDRDAAQALRGSTLYIRSDEVRDIGNEDQDMREDTEANDKSTDGSTTDSSSQSDREQEEYWVSDLVGLEVRMAVETKTRNNLQDDNIVSKQSADDDPPNTNESKDDSSLQQKNDDDSALSFIGFVNSVVLADDMCSVPGLGHDTLEVVLQKGPVPSFRDELVLIPLVPQIVTNVEMGQGYLVIDPPSGLLDLTYVRSERVRIKGFLPSQQDDDDED